MEAYRGRFLYFEIKHLGMDAVLNLDSSKPAHDHIYEMLLQKDEITWQSVLKELVKSEEMDPWDVNISKLTNKFIEILKKLKEMDFRISGKVLLAAAILLKIKSKRLIEHDFTELDEIISSTEDPDEDSFFEELEHSLEPLDQRINYEPSLIPKTPQPRKRKVSIYDLVDALEKALEVRKRRITRNIPPQNIQIPEKTVDISLVIGEVFRKIKGLFLKGTKRLTFSKLVPSNSKEDKVYTFIPLLHLTNQRKINLHQQKHFEDIEVELLKNQVKV